MLQALLLVLLLVLLQALVLVLPEQVYWLQALLPQEPGQVQVPAPWWALLAQLLQLCRAQFRVVQQVLVILGRVGGTN